MPLTEFTVSFLIEQFLKSWLDKKKKLKRAEEIAAATARLLSEENNVARKNGPGSDGDEDWFPSQEEELFDEEEYDDRFWTRKKVRENISINQLFFFSFYFKNCLFG